MDSSLLMARIGYVLMWIIFFILLAVLISSILMFFVIDTTNYTIISSKLPSAFNGYRILQLSDLHDASFGKDNKKLFKKIDKINPDIVVMTGDMVNSDTKNFNKFYDFSKKLSKKYECYYIMGNHELRLSAKQQLEILGKLNCFGIKVLNNDVMPITKDGEIIHIYGLHQPISSYKNLFKKDKYVKFTLDDMGKIFPAIDTSTFNILLSHSPFDFDVFSKWGADLVLSGHVHGGLIRLPFIGGLLSPERTLFPKYDYGEFEDGNSKMIVSRGLGNGTVNLRVFNNPEICVIELRNSK